MAIPKSNNGELSNVESSLSWCMLLPHLLQPPTSFVLKFNSPIIQVGVTKMYTIFYHEKLERTMLLQHRTRENSEVLDL